jgi:hypothetical protein
VLNLNLIGRRDHCKRRGSTCNESLHARLDYHVPGDRLGVVLHVVRGLIGRHHQGAELGVALVHHRWVGILILGSGLHLHVVLGGCLLAEDRGHRFVHRLSIVFSHFVFFVEQLQHLALCVGKVGFGLQWSGRYSLRICLK